ncbi:uncharacterized protein DUF177 involved in 23S rRNA accumulation [Roseiarcus fermentans]|uniref:Uncharacterized protein DUF177 involved in 23S rRNA accumulation n=1 Tax=Roseiarcus fermentans TaxID=1473586 RepID=A0A366EV16_9HYPH|nr:DUF177 domain-containing protein [Roseiarcus fermentans]RBP06243.1 uncharacterized protein DUF177 involved in 23S rRNA accumulation [Roseiarcus fermentans]
MQEPLSRIVRVDKLPRDGETVTIEATPAEREALAGFLKLPSIERLTATLTVRKAARGGARVTGMVRGALTQTCIVSLDPFPATVEEAVDVRFAPPDDDRPRRPGEAPEVVSMIGEDEPDPIIDGKIDLGALAAEFFALGLDPYPRKPEVAFEPPAEPEPEAAATPFAVLRGGKPANDD